MPENVNPVSFPLQMIPSLIRSASKKKFGITWQPYAVRQQKTLKVGKLDFVDYGVPCFELAKLAGIDIHKVATEIVKCIAQDRTIFTEHEADLFSLEGINGYINFQLSEKYILQLIQKTRHWLEQPSLLAGHSTPQSFLILEPSLTDGQGKVITDASCQFINQLNTLLSIPTVTYLLLSDSSEEALDLISNDIDKTRPLNVHFDKPESFISSEKMKLRRQLQRILAQTQDLTVSTTLVEVVRSSQRQWRLRRQRRLKLLGIDNVNLISESEITLKTHELIDKEIRGSNKPIIKDHTTPAAYYFIDKHTLLPLRSAQGHLFKSAYVLYALTYCLDQLKRRTGNKIVVIAPHKFHRLVMNGARAQLHKKNGAKGLICFDPQVSRPDLLEIQTEIHSLQQHFKTIDKELRNFQAADFHLINHRRALLTLLDLPVELSDAVVNNQLPLLFDTINQSITSLHQING